MSQQILGIGPLRQREAASSARAGDERRHALGVEVVERRLGAGIEGTYHAADEDPLHQREVSPMISPSSPSVSFSNARMSARISSSVRSGSGL